MDFELSSVMGAGVALWAELLQREQECIGWPEDELWQGAFDIEYLHDGHSSFG